MLLILITAAREILKLIKRILDMCQSRLFVFFNLDQANSTSDADSFLGQKKYIKQLPIIWGQSSKLSYKHMTSPHDILHTVIQNRNNQIIYWGLHWGLFKIVCKQAKDSKCSIEFSINCIVMHDKLFYLRISIISYSCSSSLSVLVSF